MKVVIGNIIKTRGRKNIFKSSERDSDCDTGKRQSYHRSYRSSNMDGKGEANPILKVPQLVNGKLRLQWIIAHTM